ncbi:cytochrome P450 [Plenodomus tracheiphilus IPT5]|uniref:Cytochrome P450 n=1 Tax=Plenodomus tracheiphilus IPT5 TaxID=1408161 RepID=A0A6A7AQH8_9PLEO|nr:cytochrome P450 [Plenodomus tracheiphilus IPT5]
MSLYNTYFHPLCDFPGPFLWTSFRLPYLVAVYQGQLHQKLKNFHTVYGNVVRIAPNELSYADPRALKDIYSRKTIRRKGLNRLEEELSSILTSNEQDHALFRRIFSHSFSGKSLRSQAEIIEHHVRKLIRDLGQEISVPQPCVRMVDMTTKLECFTLDLAGDMCFGESFGYPENGHEHPWLQITRSFGKALALIAAAELYSPLDKILKYMMPKSISQAKRNFRQMSINKTHRRLNVEGHDRVDFVTPAQRFLDDKKHGNNKLHMSHAEWEANLTVFVFAASETTATALTAILRELLQQKEALSTLTKAIREKFANETDIAISTVQDIPYLGAVIDEVLRLDPPVVVGIPRIVPLGGSIICGHWIPPGTHVAVHQYSSNRQGYNFPNPDAFDPGRFLLGTVHAPIRPFGLGRHSCIGIRFAQVLMRLTIVRLLWAFDISLADDEDHWDWGTQKTYVLWVSDYTR